MRLLSLLLAILPMFLLPAGARAQEDYNAQSLIGFSDTEKVGFAFYHLINKDPPFEDWIQSRDDYATATPDVRMRIMDQNRVRLRDGFANYITDRDMMRVRVKMLFSVTDNPDFKKDSAARAENLTKRVTIRIQDKRLSRYFPFQLGKMWIGVIPMNLDQFTQIDMNPDEYKTFCNAAYICQDIENIPYLTTLILKPTQADAKTPLMDGNIPIFLMMAEVASIGIIPAHGNMPGTVAMWSHNAPWYLNRKAQELMTLHK